MPLQFQLSEDSQQLDQYYQLRERCFREELGLDQFDGSEEEGDLTSQVFLAVEDGQCRGGVRISPHATLQSQMDALKIDGESCCMWERFAIDPAARTVDFFLQFCGHLVDATRDCGFAHAMVLSSLRNARFYRRCHSALGVDFHIHRQVPHCAQGSFAGLEHYLSVAYLQPVAQPLRLAV